MALFDGTGFGGLGLGGFDLSNFLGMDGNALGTIDYSPMGDGLESLTKGSNFAENNIDLVTGQNQFGPMALKTAGQAGQNTGYGSGGSGLGSAALLKGGLDLANLGVSAYYKNKELDLTKRQMDDNRKERNNKLNRSKNVQASLTGKTYDEVDKNFKQQNF